MNFLNIAREVTRTDDMPDVGLAIFSPAPKHRACHPYVDALSKALPCFRRDAGFHRADVSV